MCKSRRSLRTMSLYRNEKMLALVDLHAVFRIIWSVTHGAVLVILVAYTGNFFVVFVAAFTSCSDVPEFFLSQPSGVLLVLLQAAMTQLNCYSVAEGPNGLQVHCAVFALSAAVSNSGSVGQPAVVSNTGCTDAASNLTLLNDLPICLRDHVVLNRVRVHRICS